MVERFRAVVHDVRSFTLERIHVARALVEHKKYSTRAEVLKRPAFVRHNGLSMIQIDWFGQSESTRHPGNYDWYTTKVSPIRNPSFSFCYTAITRSTAVYRRILSSLFPEFCFEGVGEGDGRLAVNIYLMLAEHFFGYNFRSLRPGTRIVEESQYAQVFFSITREKVFDKHLTVSRSHNT